MPDARLTEFAGYLAGLPAEQRELELKKLKLTIAANADSANLLAAPPIRTLDEYLTAEVSMPPVLVEPSIVLRGETTLTVGRAGKGKTSMNLNRLMRWSAGLSWFDELDALRPVTPLKALIIENEGAAGMFQRKIGRTFASDFLDDEARELVRENFLIWGEGGWSGMKLDDDEKYDLLRRGVEQWQPDVLFVEPLRSLWRGEENSSTDMQLVLDRFAELATEYGVGIIVSHHERKSGAGEDGEKMSAARGSGALEGFVAVMEHFEPVKGGALREVSYSKVRYDDGRTPAPFRLDWHPESESYTLVPQEKGSRELLEAMIANEEPMTISQLSEELDEKQHVVRKIVTKLVDEGQLAKLPSAYIPGGGTTGHMYRVVGAGGEDEGGLEF